MRPNLGRMRKLIEMGNIMQLILQALVVCLTVFCGVGAVLMVFGLYRTYKAIKADSKECNWTDESQSCHVYQTSCKNEFYNANDGNPVTEWAKYCPYCRGEIVNN